MSANSAVATAVVPAQNGERAHRIRLVTGYVVAIALILGLAVYGFSYYTSRLRKGHSLRSTRF